MSVAHDPHDRHESKAYNNELMNRCLQDVKGLLIENEMK